MADRHRLHFNKLEKFKNWLIKNDWEIKPLSKSPYEVLRATKNGKWVIVYIKDEATEHYSLTENSISVVNQWLRERKIRKQVCNEIWQEFENRLMNKTEDMPVINVAHLINSVLDQIQGDR